MLEIPKPPNGLPSRIHPDRDLHPILQECCNSGCVRRRYSLLSVPLPWVCCTPRVWLEKCCPSRAISQANYEHLKGAREMNPCPRQFAVENFWLRLCRHIVIISLLPFHGVTVVSPARRVSVATRFFFGGCDEVSIVGVGGGV